MYSIVYEFEGKKVTVGGFEGVFDCLKKLEAQGFDISHPINGSTVTDGSTKATVETDPPGDVQLSDALEAAEFALFEARNTARGIDAYEKEAAVLENLRVVVERMMLEL